MAVKYGGAAADQAKAKPSANKASSGGASFMKRGAAARKALEEDEARAAQRQAEIGKAWRFYIPKDKLGEDFKVTFLDGDLDEDGMLDLLAWDEHTVMNEGKPEQYVCTADNEPCPLCHAGNRSSYVAAFTIIDHSEYEIRKGDRKGQIITNEKKLYVVKRSTIGKLQKFATKTGGLRGAQFQVSRSSKDSPNCGDMFMLECQFDEAELTEMFAGEKGDKKGEGEGHLPLDYEKEVPYRDAKTLVKLGVAGAVDGVSSKVGASKDFTQEM